jgi:hypothetical protein
MEEEEKMEKVNGGCECKNSLKRSLRQKKRRWRGDTRKGRE